MDKIKQYIKENNERFLDELFSLIRIPSISTKEGHEKDIIACAEKYIELLKKAGVDSAKLLKTEGNPIIYAEKIVSKDLPTALIYAHYDVVDVDGQNWLSDPFSPEIRDGKIWARGADDDKGQGFMHVKAFEYIIKEEKLPFNVKFIIEGEEEIGSKNFTQFCKNNKELLKADFAMVSDTTMINSETPCVMTGLRGIVSWNITVKGAKQEVHSGHYGGAIVNPINELCRIIAALKNQDNQISIPNFYDDVISYNEEERKHLQETPLDKKSLEDAGITKFEGEKGFETIEHIGIRPSLDVLEISGGFGGNKIPKIASAKISCRLVPLQDKNIIGKLMIDHINKIKSKNVDVEVKFNDGENPYHSRMIEVPYINIAEKAYQKVYGMKPYDKKNGGSIGAITILYNELGLKSLVMGFGLSSDVIHGADENYPLSQFFNGIETIIYFYKYFSVN